MKELFVNGNQPEWNQDYLIHIDVLSEPEINRFGYLKNFFFPNTTDIYFFNGETNVTQLYKFFG